MSATIDGITVAVTPLSRPAERVDLLQLIQDIEAHWLTKACTHTERKLWYRCAQILKSEDIADKGDVNAK